DELRTPEDWTDRMHPEDRPRYRQALIAHLKGVTPRFECEMRYRTRAGEWRWARQHGIALRGRDGRARRLVGATGDITDRKQDLAAARAAAETARAETGRTRDMMQTVLDNMSDGAALYHQDLRLALQPPPSRRDPGLSVRPAASGRVAPRDHSPPGRARRAWRGRRRRREGRIAAGPRVEAGGEPLRAAHGERPPCRIRLHA